MKFDGIDDEEFETMTDPANREKLRQLLAAAGHVLNADSSREALRRVERGLYDAWNAFWPDADAAAPGGTRDEA